MRKKLLKKCGIFFIVFVFTLSLCFVDGHNAKATQNKPDVKITVTTNKNNVLVNEEFEIKYRIEPEPIDVKDINKSGDKEIILVVDTSGSMNDWIQWGKTRMQALKEAAKDFTKKFKDEDNVKIGIVSYDYSAKKSIELRSSKEQEKLNNAIDALEAEGATNIGDGIRVAANMFSKDSDVKKYLVLMSDGMPTTLNYVGVGGYCNRGICISTESIEKWPNRYRWDSRINENSNWNYFGINDNVKEMKIGNYGNYDPKGYCLKYSKLMAEEIKKSGITNYVIGFSGGSDGTKLIQIAESGGGTYYDARDAKAIKEVYFNIADQIKADYAVEDIKVNFNLPDGMECSVDNSEIFKQGNGYIKSIPNIIYKLNENKTKYIADPFDIVIKIKPNKSGKYYNLGEGWQLSYKGINGVIVKHLPKVDINANKYNIDFDVSRRIIPEIDNGEFNINKEFEIEYTIKPKPIPAEINEIPKEIMLVVDNSKSMEWSIDEDYTKGDSSRLDLTKEALKNFIEKFKDSKDVKIGLVTYSNQGEVYNNEGKYFFDSKDSYILKNKIKNLKANGGTNLGDGLRKAAWALSQNKDSKKYIVLMSDGEPTFYSYNYDWNKGFIFYTELDNRDVLTNISNEEDNGLEYSKLIAKVLRENKELDLKTFAIGFSKGANSNKLKEISDSAEGIYLDATTNDKEAINNVYMNIADNIKTDFVLDNAKLNENLPEGFTLADSGNKHFNKDFKINYVYNAERKQYEAEVIKFKLKVIPSKLGTYELKDDSEFSYTDLEGIRYTKRFNPLNISIVDDYIIKQGLFQKYGTEQSNYPGENNIKYLDNINIANDSLTRLAAFIRTSGQQTNVKIDLNEDKNSKIKKLYDININVFQVDSKGNLNKIDANKEIKKIHNNCAEISINLPKKNDNEYGYYIVNYDFKVNIKDEHNIKDSINMTSRCEIEGVNRRDDLYIKIGELPDLF